MAGLLVTQLAYQYAPAPAPAMVTAPGSLPVSLPLLPLISPMRYDLTGALHSPNALYNAKIYTKSSTKPERRDVRLQELGELILERSYFPKLVDCSIVRAKAIPRKTVLEKLIYLNV